MKLRDISRRIREGDQPDISFALQGGLELSDIQTELLADFPETVYIANSQSFIFGKVQKETLLYLIDRQRAFRFQQILDSMNDGVIAVDETGRIFYANPAYVSILGGAAAADHGEDDSLHLLAFDVIYCSRAYNFYQGIYYIPKSESTSAYNKEQLRLKEEAKVQERIDSLETQIQAKDIELDKFRSISLLNVRVTHKQYGTGVVIAQKENTIKVRFPEGLEKSFIIHTKFPARPTFEDDEQVVEAFTEYDRLTREIQGLKKLLEIEKAKVQTTIL